MSGWKGNAHLSKLRQHRGAVATLQLKEIVHVLSALDLTENAEVLQCQLDGHFDSVELQEVHLALSH